MHCCGIRAGIAVGLLAASPLFAWDQGKPQPPGSVLVFPAVEIKWRAIANDPRMPYAVSMDTIVEIENDGPGVVDLHMFYVNGDAPAVDEPGWNRQECRFSLDRGQTLQFSAALGNAVCGPFANLDPGVPPGRLEREAKLQSTRMLRGYIMVWAENELGHEVRWNHLSGQATLIHYEAATTASYDAYSFTACPSGAHECADGEEPDDVPGRIALNGVEYSFADKALRFDFFGVGASYLSHAVTSIAHDFEVTLMPVSRDLRASAGTPMAADMRFEVSNENGDRFSGPHRCVTGWYQVYASRFPDFLDPFAFSTYSLGTDTGRAWVASASSEACVGSRPFGIVGVVTELTVYSNARIARGFATDARRLEGTQPAHALIRFDVPGGQDRFDPADDFGPGVVELESDAVE